MRAIVATSLFAVALASTAARAQVDEISLGWYADNWEATTFPMDGQWECSVDSLADNYPDFAGAWVFVFPTYLQFSPNEGLPMNGGGRVSIDGGPSFDMALYNGQAGFVSDADDLPLLQSIAHGSEMTIEVWNGVQSGATTREYVYSLDGFREAYLRIAAECNFDPSPVLDQSVALAPSQALPGKN
ncbi:MAG: hypothetical protein R3F55_24800 [Alphaproteobacteria bacterium]